MSENNVVQLDSETLSYIMRDGDFTGVKDLSAGISIVDDWFVPGTTIVSSVAEKPISNEKLKSLFVAWLALKYPEVLKFDE